MSENTVEQNRQSQLFQQFEQVWLFAYGSLIFKVDFPYLEKRKAAIRGWQRRFWQGSHDHRGTPAQPGRVVTLVPTAAACCEGIAYLITPEEFAHLDHREKNGYLRFSVPLYFNAQSHNSDEKALIYIADKANRAFLGPAKEIEIAQQIANSEGPSGTNGEYLCELAAALRSLDIVDEHIFSIEKHYRELGGANKP